MLKKDLDEYKRLDEVFNNECTRVSQALKEWDPDFNYAKEYVLDDNRIICECYLYLGYGSSDNFVMSFPTQLLTYSENELREYVNNKVETERKIKEMNEKKMQQGREKAVAVTRAEQEREVARLAAEKAEYERLKTKFGK